MKLGLISDIHGDVISLELAWAHLTILGVDRIVCAGDLVGYGPRPDRAAAFLAEHRIGSVRGNHDRWAIDRGPAAPDPYGGGPPSAATIDRLRGLPPDLLIADGGRVGVVVHGAPGDDMTFIDRSSYPPDRLDDLLGRLGADLLVVGHTHRPMWSRTRRGLVINPGSIISAPVVSTSRTFAVLDWDLGSPSFHDVETGAEVSVRPWANRG